MTNPNTAPSATSPDQLKGCDLTLDLLVAAGVITREKAFQCRDIFKSAYMGDAGGAAPSADSDGGADQSELTSWEHRLRAIADDFHPDRDADAPLALQEMRSALLALPDAALAEFTDYFVRNYPGPDTIITDPKWHAPKLFRAAQRAISRDGLRSGVSADPLPRPLLTDLEIQGLRRQARNDPRCADQHWFILMVRAIESYYGVTGAAAQSQPLVEPTAARVSFLLEQKSVLPHWENLMAYQSEDSARKALPVFRKTTSRDIRIVRQTREVVAVDSVAASPPQHQVKKGEPS